MKFIVSKTETSIINRALSRRGLLWSFGLTAALASSVLRAGSVGAQHYQQVNLVSDVAGVAQLQDPDLVNVWGISFSATSPFWVSDNGTGKSTLYSVTNDTSGDMVVTKQGLIVQIPGQGTATGQLFNGTGQFHGDIFIFASEDGVISGWRPALGTNAEVLVTNPDAVYKGITLAMTTNGPILLVANFSQGTVDAYDGNLSPVGRFADAHAPSGYAPFNVQSVQGMIFVTFALQDQDRQNDVAGSGHGLIDVLDPSAGIFHRFAAGRAAGGHLRDINSPWGITLAPSTFGKHAGELLVGNFGSGTIMTFDPDGKFRGLLEGQDEGPMVIDGLWALAFGNNAQAGSQDTLFFTAGPDHESHGLFGGITPIKQGRDQE